MKSLFIDHSFHKKTNSSAFFVSILREWMDVEVNFVDPSDPVSVLGLKTDGYDFIVIWQLDFLAPIFLARGLRTIVVPMYDGSALMPDLHWLWSREARFINFGRRLHHKIAALNGQSMYVRYYKAPAPEADLPNFESLRAFLWQRSPEHGINVGLVKALLGDEIASLHVHDAPDDQTINSQPYLEAPPGGFDLTISRWFEDASGYEDALSKANIFIAPRRSEGIGMALLEAMSRGMVVLAADEATHDEYVANWINGILFNPDNPGPVSFYGARHASLIGRSAWRSAGLGFDEFQAQIPLIRNYITTTPSPRVDSAAARKMEAVAETMISAFLSGVEAYGHFLRNNAAIISGFNNDVSISDRTKTTSNSEDIDDAQRARPWLDQNRFDARGLVSGSHVLTGVLFERDDVAWLEGDRLKLGFRMDHRLGSPSRLRARLRKGASASTRSYCFTLNDRPLRLGEMADEREDLEIDVTAHVGPLDNVLCLYVSDPHFEPGLGRTASIGLEAIEFV